MVVVFFFYAFAAFAQQPRIDGLSPSSGPIAGGTIVTLTGSAFTGATVTLDGAPVSTRSRTDTEIQLQMPAHANGIGVVAIASGSGTAYSRFLYLPPPLQDLPAGYITTVAGIGNYGGEYGPATDAWFPLAIGMAFDRSGRLYFTDTNRNRIMRIRNDGILEPFAGNGFNSGPRPAGKTPALDVSITFPRSIAFDSAGNLIVPDDGRYLWRIDANGLAEIIAGDGRWPTPGTPEGVPALGTSIGQPSFVAVDAEDNIYFQDWPSARVRRIDRGGILTTYAGNGTYGFGGDGGLARDAQFDEQSNDFGGLVFDRSGNLLLVDAGNRRIRRVNRATGTIETIVGPEIDGHGLDNLRGLAVGPNNEIYFSNAAELYERSSGGTIAKIASGRRGYSSDGERLPAATLGIIYALAIDGDGDLLYADADIGRIRKINLATKTLSTIAGSGPPVFGEGQSALAAAASVTGLSFLPSGELVMSWFVGANAVFKIDGTGRLVRIAGSPFGPLFDVPALEAMIGTASVAVSGDGTIDLAGSTVARIDPDGVVRHTAGRPGRCGFSGDGGKAIDALLCQPWDAIRDRYGNVLIADTNNNRVRRVRATDGIIETVAGSGPVNGFERYNGGSYCGDGGAATSACLNTPYGLASGDEDDLFVCEGGRVRRVDRNGMIQTIAKPGCTKLAWAFGNVYSIGGDGLKRTSRTGKITLLTRSGVGFGGDGGPASEADIESRLQGGAVAVDAEGNLFFNDADNQRIRAIRFGAVLAPPGSTMEASRKGNAVIAHVRDAEGAPAEGVRVDFAVSSSGASCFLSSKFVVTDKAGMASVSCAPNCLPGTYAVTARPVGSHSSAVVSLTNGALPCRRRPVRR